jgi:hypothetical protein
MKVVFLILKIIKLNLLNNTIFGINTVTKKAPFILTVLFYKYTIKAYASDTTLILTLE